MKDKKFVYRLLSIVAEHNIIDELCWEKDLSAFFIIVNDTFFWGSADAEYIETQEDLDLLEQSCKDIKHFGAILYASRKRGTRPQDPIYKWFDTQEEKDLFNSCGPIQGTTI